MTFGGLSAAMLILPLIMVTLAIVVMFVLRELFTWYWKQNEIVAKLEKISGLLETIALNQQVEPISNQPSPGITPVPPPKPVARKSRAKIEEEKYGPPKRKQLQPKSIKIT